MNERLEAGLTSVETKRTHRGFQRSLKHSYLALDEESRYLRVMAEAPAASPPPVVVDLAQGGYAAPQRAANGAAAPYVDPEDLAEFEGEGGRQAPEPAAPVLKRAGRPWHRKSEPHFMKQVFTATESVELELLKNMLEAAGISCALRNQQLSQAFPAIPFAVELWVEREDDFQKAQDLCQAWFNPPPGATGSWTCAHCGQRLKGQFDSCWKCGTQRETPDPFNRKGKEDEDDENVSRFVD